MEIRTRQVVEWRVEALWDHGFKFAADQGLAIMISHAPDPAAAALTAAGCSGAGPSPAGTAVSNGGTASRRARS